MNSNLYKKAYKLVLGSNDLIHYATKFGENVKLGHGVIIDEDCVVGNDTFIGHHVVLRSHTRIGNNCMIGHLVVCEGNATIGNRVTIHDQSHITKGAIIEDDVFIAPGLFGANTPKIVHGRNFPLVLKPYKVKRAARIGMAVTILPGLIIGENSLVGAGSVVTHNVPDGEIWFGNPATKHGDVPKDELL